MIQAKIVADSVNQQGNRITTMQVTFPRFILAELNTHRMFSRNSASSRAIPFEKMLKSVEENPFIPIAWQKDHKGMQGVEYFTNKDTIIEGGEKSKIDFLKNMWLKAKDCAILSAKYLNDNKLTKQLCNRLLEPFMWHTVLITATEWENFFALRCPQYQLSLEIVRSRKEAIRLYPNIYSNFTELDWFKINKGQAEIHMMALAEAMWDAYNESVPEQLESGDWHIPFQDGISVSHLLDNYFQGSAIGSDIDRLKDLQIKISTAMCARVSYTVVGEESKEPNYENDIKLHDRLSQSGHWSPFEHIAQAVKVITNEDAPFYLIDTNPVSDHSILPEGIVTETENLGNFKGWKQYRKFFNNENIK